MESSVPRSTGSVIGAAEDVVEDAVEIVEEIFLPKPGGMVSRHQAEKARREAAAEESKNVSHRVEEPSYKAVKTATVKPESFVTNMVTIAPGAFAQILPLSPYRYRATIIVATPAGTAVLAKDSSAALGGIG